MSPSSMEKSVRASRAAAQKPLSSSIGNFVVAMATEMSMRSGTSESRVRKPSKMNAPNPISTTPTKRAIVARSGIPIFAKRPAPKASGKRNFRIPSEKNTVPARTRIRIVAAGALDLAVSELRSTTFPPSSAPGSGLQECQQVGIELLLVSLGQAMGCACIDLQSRVFDEFR
jgi:hypothetical protein